MQSNYFVALLSRFFLSLMFLLPGFVKWQDWDRRRLYSNEQTKVAGAFDRSSHHWRKWYLINSHGEKTTHHTGRWISLTSYILPEAWGRGCFPYCMQRDSDSALWCHPWEVPIQPLHLSSLLWLKTFSDPPSVKGIQHLLLMPTGHCKKWFLVTQETKKLLHVPVAGTATTSTTNCLHTENEEEGAHEKETQMAVNSSRGKKKERKNANERD